MISKITKILSYFAKSKTLITMVALAVLPALDLLGQIDMQGIFAAFACGEEQAAECVAGLPAKANEIYMLVITGLGTALRFVTHKPLSEK